MQKDPTVGAFVDSPIENHDRASVAFGSNESPEALSELDDRLGQGIRPKRIVPSRFRGFDTGLCNGVSGNSEGKPGNDDLPQALSLHADPFPEAVGAKQDRIPGTPKSGEQP